MSLRHFIALVAILMAATHGCVSTKSEPVEQVPESCAQAAERWAAGAPIQGQPQPDGGVLFIKPGVDSLEFFIVVSPKFLPQVRQAVVEGQQSKTIGLAKEGMCVHPQNSFVYHTVQFRVTPTKQQVSSPL